MRRIFIILNLLLIPVLFSCKKSNNSPSNNPSPVVQPNLLSKIVSKTGNDSVVTEYSYDANKRLIFEKVTNVTSGVTKKTSLKLTRNNNGIVTRTTEIADYLIANGVDSIVILFTNAAGKYTFSVSDIMQGATSIHDSVSYSYDGIGRIIKAEHFELVSGIPFVQMFKDEYVYSSGGNLDSIKGYDFLSGAYTLSSTVAYDYDTKINALQLQNDAVITYHFGLFGANNATKTKADFVGSPSNNSLTTVVYTYGNDNRPSASVTTRMPSGNVSNETYFYQ